jgi:hypothetical protein
MNGLDPNLMTAEERLDEAAEILSACFLRWYRKRAEKSQIKEKDYLDLSTKQRLHVHETIDNSGETL